MKNSSKLVNYSVQSFRQSRMYVCTSFEKSVVDLNVFVRMSFDRYRRIFYWIIWASYSSVDFVSLCRSWLLNISRRLGNEQRAIIIDVYACLIEQHKSVSFLCKHNKNLFLLLILLCAVEVRMLVENPQTNEVKHRFLFLIIDSSRSLE